MNAASFRDEFLAALREMEDDPAHVMHVARLSLQLFDRFQPLHALSVEDRLLLEAAAHLHDVGWRTALDGREHHKESARLIRLRPWSSLAPVEVEILAQVARYHRRAIPSVEHEAFAGLAETDRERVRRLAAILRLADALDRRHEERVVQVDCDIHPRRLQFRLHAPLNVDPEIAAAEKKGDLARLVFERELVFHRVAINAGKWAGSGNARKG
jgi:exopolyphosphatase/guanosine-5'-triphosphate,3'-diphosphate pyrophosphatase